MLLLHPPDLNLNFWTYPLLSCSHDSRLAPRDITVCFFLIYQDLMTKSLKSSSLVDAHQYLTLTCSRLFLHHHESLLQELFDSLHLQLKSLPLLIHSKLSQILSLFCARIMEINGGSDSLLSKLRSFDPHKLLGASSKGLQRHNLCCLWFCEVYLGGHAWTVSETSFCSDPVGNFPWRCGELVHLIFPFCSWFLDFILGFDHCSVESYLLWLVTCYASLIHILSEWSKHSCTLKEVSNSIQLHNNFGIDRWTTWLDLISFEKDDIV